MEQAVSEGKAEKDQATIAGGSVETGMVDRDLDLKGKICPYTFIESMLALEEMKVGEVLRVIVDYAPAACDVPRSLKNEGYEILGVDRLNETDWAILVRNREFEE